MKYVAQKSLASTFMMKLCYIQLVSCLSAEAIVQLHCISVKH